MNEKIFIVMYHYVREIKSSKYPNLKGLEFKNFKEQINFFTKNYDILSNDSFVEIIKKKNFLKKKSILLTFDDGYKDHFNYVYPYLKKKNIKANFYTPVKAVENKKILDMNKIHFILAREENRHKLIKHIFDYLKKNKNDKIINNINKIKTNSRFDDKDTSLIKILLQSFLPFNIREKLLSELFGIIIDVNEENFARELYMNISDIQQMYKDSMTFGSHGDYHLRWGNLNFINQEKEIDNSIKFFKNIKIYSTNFSVSYPYGSYNKDTIKILKKRDFSFALTTKPDYLRKKYLRNIYEFPRFDTNDFQ